MNDVLKTKKNITNLSKQQHQNNSTYPIFSFGSIFPKIQTFLNPSIKNRSKLLTLYPSISKFPEQFNFKYNLKPINPLIYLAYISILIRIIPVVLQWISFSKKNQGAKFLFLFTLISFLSDAISVIFSHIKANTDFMFNLYQISEVVIVTFLAIEVGNFKNKLKTTILTACALQVVFFVSICLLLNLESSQDYISSVSKLYILIILFLAATHFIQNAESNRKIETTPLMGLLGIFIYEALSFIPLITMQLQRLSNHPKQVFNIYLILMISGNVIRDALVTYHAIVQIKKSSE